MVISESSHQALKEKEKKVYDISVVLRAQSNNLNAICLNTNEGPVNVLLCALALLILESDEPDHVLNLLFEIIHLQLQSTALEVLLENLGGEKQIRENRAAQTITILEELHDELEFCQVKTEERTSWPETNTAERSFRVLFSAMFP